MARLRNSLATLLLLTSVQAVADLGNPVAVRCWPNGAISIETMWDLNLVIDTTGTASQQLKASADRVVTFEGDTQHALDRLANNEKVQWQSLDSGREQSSNKVVVKGLNAGNAASAWAIHVSVDGVSILCVDVDSAPSDNLKAVAGLKDSQVVILTLKTEQSLTRLAEIIECITAAKVILNPASSQVDLSNVEDTVAAVKNFSVSEHNTLAVSSLIGQQDELTVIKLATQPKAMPEELAELFSRMESSCEASQMVFKKLSIAQMNWKPSNGTHTPRWNIEHMMARQLRFFSQIYHAIDSVIPTIDLNPKQMPDQYEYAHEDWTGAEEARQMQRVSSFTRRFAYLIHDLDVEERAPGSRWPSLKKLLLQMENHYSEHTENTVKKFDLPDWPTE